MIIPITGSKKIKVRIKGFFMIYKQKSQDFHLNPDFIYFEFMVNTQPAK